MDPTVPVTAGDTRQHEPVQSIGGASRLMLSATGIESEQARESGARSGYVAVEASIVALEQEADDIYKRIDAVYTQGDDALQLALEAFENSYAAAAESALDKGEDAPSYAAYLDGAKDIPAAVKDDLLAHETCCQKIEATQGMLEDYAAEKAIDVLHKVADFEQSLDYDKVVEQAYSDDDNPIPIDGARISSINLLYVLGRMIGTRKILEGNLPFTYPYLQSIERQLETLIVDCTDQGLVRAEGTRNTDSTVVPPMTKAQVSQLKHHIDQAGDLLWKYKPYEQLDNAVRPVADLIRMIKSGNEATFTGDMPQTAGEALNLLYTRPGYISNDQLDTALRRRLTRKFQDLPAQIYAYDTNADDYLELVDELRSVDVAQAFKNLEIVGSLENLPFDFSEAELKIFLASSIPPAALGSVKRIAFRAMTPEEDTEDTLLGYHRHSSELGGSEIVISDAQVMREYLSMLAFMGEDPDAERFAQATAKQSMLRTLVHEFAHELHEILPVATLRRWESQRASEPVNVSAYVKRRHDSNHHHRYMEDFADTMNLFTQQPEVLALIAPRRFQAMKQIFHEFMPLYPAVLMKSQDRRIAIDRAVRLAEGMTDQSVVESYLRHET